MDIGKKIRGIKKLINNGAIIDSVDVLILIQEIERVQKKVKKIEEDRDNIVIEAGKLTANLYEANNRIVHLMDIIDERDKIIDLMANEIYIEHNPHFNTVEEVKEYFLGRCN